MVFANMTLSEGIVTAGAEMGLVVSVGPAGIEPATEGL